MLNNLIQIYLFTISECNTELMNVNICIAKANICMDVHCTHTLLTYNHVVWLGLL